MCQFASFLINGDTAEVTVYDLTSHSETQEKLGLRDDGRSGKWREGHYLPDGTIECRAIAGDEFTADQLVSSVKSAWPTFLRFLAWAVREKSAIISDNISLNGLTSAKDLVLPEKIDGSLSLDGLTSAKDLVLPEKIGMSLFLNGLTTAKDLVLPKKIGGSLYLAGLTSEEREAVYRKMRGG